jgi:hypothetical protein
MKYTGLLTKQSLFVAIATLFTASFALTLWMAFYVPVYEDEIAWKLFSNRLFIDQGKLVYLFAQCNRGYWLDMPLTWYPTQWLDSIIYGDASNPSFLRTMGWFGFVALMASWVVILRTTSKLSWVTCALFIAVFFSFGVTPFIMVFNRPEQPLLIWLTVMLLVTLWFDHRPLKSYLSRALVTVLFALLACLMAATHPKGLFFFPLVLLAWWRCVKWWPASIPLLGVMAWTAIATKRIWFLRTACEEFPGLTEMLQRLTLRPKQLWKDPLEFIDGVFENLDNSTRYISQMAFDESYANDWLPPSEDLFSHLSGAWVTEILIWLPIILIVLVILLNLLHRVHSTVRGVRYWPIALFLLLSLLVVISFQTAKNFYESALIWPLLLLVAIYTFKGSEQVWSNRLIRWVLPILLVASLCSSYIRYELFFKPAQTWQKTQAQGGLFNVNDLQRFAKSQCSIESDTPNLVLGFSSYAAFYQNRKPIFLAYSSGWWGAESSFAQTMRQREAGGLVAQCKDLPAETKPFAKQQGQFCCVSGSDLRNLVNTQPSQK